MGNAMTRKGLCCRLLVATGVVMQLTGVRYNLAAAVQDKNASGLVVAVAVATAATFTATRTPSITPFNSFQTRVYIILCQQALLDDVTLLPVVLKLCFCQGPWCVGSHPAGRH